VYNDLIFIANKKAFEISMNFREGMKNNAAEVLKEFENLNFLSDVEPIRHYVGSNLHHLRKLSLIQKSGYYKKEHYLEKMMTVSAEEGWELKIENQKITVEKETIEGRFKS
jgi:hypothetical protein